ncbi:hypothetical protein MUP07_00705 [Candidatus Bathyarchaeota archaeon]|nr:hypothetical protein [Candidatus Bathyarchaeota archaeon]
MVRTISRYYCEKPKCQLPPFDNEKEALEHEAQEHCALCGYVMADHPMTMYEETSKTIRWRCDGKEIDLDPEREGARLLAKHRAEAKAKSVRE